MPEGGGQVYFVDITSRMPLKSVAKKLVGSDSLWGNSEENQCQCECKWQFWGRNRLISNFRDDQANVTVK
jgi:hypothetical protein